MRTRWIALAFTAAWLAFALPAGAQPYPTRPVHLIVPFAPGGLTDVVARLLAPHLAASLSHPVIVDNRPGAGSNIGIGLVARAPADGHTLLVVSSVFAVNPSLYPNVSYDPYRDFEPVTCVGSAPNMMAVHPSLPVKTVHELIALVRAQPGRHNYASPGNGTTPHLSGEMFRVALQLDMNHVPFNGAAPAVQAMLSGQVPIGFASVPSFASQVKGGKLRGIVVTADRRTSTLPDVPSTAETGLPGMAADTFQGVLAPSGTPKAIVSRLHRDIVKALGLPEVRERLTAIGLETVANSPDEFAAQLKSDIAKWEKVIRQMNIKPD